MEKREYSEEIDLQKYWLVVKRRWLPATGVFSGVVALSALAALTQKPTYEATASLLIKPDRSSSLVGLDVNSHVGDDLRALTQQGSPAENQSQIVTSPSIAKQTIATLNLTDADGKLIDVKDFSKKLKVKNVPTTDVLTVTYSARTPEEAAAVVNKVMELYIESDVIGNRAEAASAREFIGSQLPEVEAAVRRAEASLRQFKEDNKVIALDNEAQSAVTVISNLEQQIAQTKGQLASTAAQAERLRYQLGMDTQQALTSAALSQSSGVQDALKQYQDAQNQLTVALTRYRPEHPAVTNLERRVEALRTQLQQRIGGIIKNQQPVSDGQMQVGITQQHLIENLSNAEAQQLGLANQLNTLVATQAAYRARASTLPKLQQQEAELERQLKASQSTYETLLNRLQEVQVAENQNVGNARVISKALVPDKPVPSRKLVYLAAGAAIGMLLGIAAAFGLDLADRSVKTLKQARELLKYPLLGVIPAFGKVGLKTVSEVPEGTALPVWIRDMPRSPICNSYQMLQANLGFLTSDQPLRSIVITSSIPKEGKSTTSANLAAAMAQVGRRVLLVDADLRQPYQHHVWDLTNQSGLSHVIVGQTEFGHAVQTVLPNLDVLTAGVIPPNPVALLDSNRMASLVQTFNDIYDFVIFDTPPLSGTADAAVLGKLTDGLLLVVRPGVIDSASATAAKEYLVQSGQKVLGLVANGVITEAEPDSYFYHTRETKNWVGQDTALQEMMYSSTSSRNQ